MSKRFRYLPLRKPSTARPLRPYPRPEPERFGRRHFRKLVISWAAAAALLAYLMFDAPRGERPFYFGIWLVLSLPLVIVTWIWLSEREK